MIERAELCVHRNSTLKAGVMPLSSSGLGEAGGDVAAQFGPAAAAGLGQEAEQLPQAREPHGVDDLPALAGGLRQAGALERGEMEREGRGGHCEPRRDVTRRKAGGALRDQQAHQVEPGFLRQCREGGGGLRCFHVSSLTEMTMGGKGAGGFPAHLSSRCAMAD